MLAAVDKHIPRAAIDPAAARYAAPALKARDSLCGHVVICAADVHLRGVIVTLAYCLEHCLQYVDELPAVALCGDVLSRREHRIRHRIPAQILAVYADYLVPRHAVGGACIGQPVLPLKGAHGNGGLIAVDAVGDNERYFVIHQSYRVEIGLQFDDVLPTMIDEDGYLSFEFVYMNKELLGENDHGAGRGTRCTSVDAFMIARKGDRKVLIPIEWKYTESYKWQDKTIAKRLARYEQLIEGSSQLISPENGIPHSIYFYEPCYELMRQTLLAEQMVKKGVADDFIHINVVPARNTEYRNMVKYNYIPMLKKKQKFIPITPEELLAPLNNKIEYSALIQYLSKRYWA